MKPSVYIPGLDGMRTISILLVILGHSGLTFVPGALGVTIFFFISGFLITNLLLIEQDASDRIDVKAFYIRRYLRLMPEMAFYVAVGLVVGLFLNALPSLLSTLAALFYFTNYLKAFHVSGEVMPFVTGHFWSLAVEEHFYLTWPLAFSVLAPNYRNMLGALLAVLVACFAWRLFIVTQGLFPASYIEFASDTRFDSIAFGCICAVLFRKNPAFIARLASARWLVLFAGAALLLIPSLWRTVFGLNETFQEAARYTVQGAGFILCFIFLYRAPPSWLQALIMRILETPLMRFCGRASYGAYIWHFAVIYIFMAAIGSLTPEEMSLTNKLICAAITAIVSMMLGHYSGKLVLGPFASLRRKFGSHVQVKSPVPAQ